MPDIGVAVVIYYSNDVKAYRQFQIAVPEVCVGSAYYSSDFLACDGILGIPETGAAASLDLNYYQLVFLACDKVNLLMAASPVAFQDGVSGVLQIAGGDILSFYAKLIVRCHICSLIWQKYIEFACIHSLNVFFQTVWLE